MRRPTRIVSQSQQQRETAFQAILNDLRDETSSPQQTAQILANRILAGNIEGDLGLTWTLILNYVREKPEQIEHLVDLLVCLTDLPAAKNDEGDEIELYESKVFGGELPMFGWEMNSAWNSVYRTTISRPRKWFTYNASGLLVPAEPSPERAKVIEGFTNVNEFTAKLMLRDRPAFNFSLFALWTFRSALEYRLKPAQNDHDQDAHIAAAAKWIFIAGEMVYQWDQVFPHGGNLGAPGRGGELWDGVHGFCGERWELWRKRFGELAETEFLDDELRDVARRAEAKMGQIESSHV